MGVAFLPQEEELVRPDDADYNDPRWSYRQGDKEIDEERKRSAGDRTGAGESRNGDGKPVSVLMVTTGMNLAALVRVDTKTRAGGE
jgi:hypothetical protein